jgi:hypothetical protein
MERTNGSQVQSNSSQSKLNIQSITDKFGPKDVSQTQRQYNRSNNKTRRQDFNRNVGKGLAQVNSCAKQSLHSRSRPRGSGSVAATDEWLGHLNDNCVDRLDEKKIYGSKKHNMNHLLNFTFGSRDETLTEQRFHYNRNNGKTGQQRYHMKHAYNKEHFLQANCQFIVNDLNDYSVHALDPDICVDWNSVEEIRFNSLTAETVCPICLDSPIAPKITRCGHIYCWSCVLHYLALSDHKWRKCPICFDAVNKDDLRSVSSFHKIDYKIGDFITLSLMKRKKGSTLSTPVFLYDNNKNQMFEPLNGDPIISSYQKILIASPNQVLTDIIGRERNQLLAQMVEDKDTPEVCFIESALQQLKDRETSLLQKCDKNQNPINDSKDDFEVKHNMNANSVEHKLQLQRQGTAAKEEEYYYFYQSEDGQHIYLHSLNVRMLKQEFGTLDKSPIKIKAKIIEMEWESMSDELRRRLRYLQHLPLTCEFRIVELEFDNQLISESTLDAFKEEVIRRQKVRGKRAREERRRERHIKVEENKRIYGIYPLPKYQLDNYQQFPKCHDNGLNGSISPTSLSESSTIEDMPHINDNISTISGTSPPSVEPEFPSFARMLREGKAKPLTNIQTTQSNTKARNGDKDSEDEYMAPEYHQYSLSDALAAALELKSSTSNQSVDNEDKKGGKKKKKNRPKILMSTGMKRNY